MSGRKTNLMIALEDKPVTLAIREVANGELTANLKDEYTK